MEEEKGEGVPDPPSATKEEKSGGGGQSIEVVQELIEAVNQISTISDFRNAFKKQFCNLARLLKLLSPMFEEFRESKEPIAEETLRSLVSLKDALVKAKEVLRFGSKGSKIFLASPSHHDFIERCDRRYERDGNRVKKPILMEFISPVKTKTVKEDELDEFCPVMERQ